jgi:hypothetical protein
MDSQATVREIEIVVVIILEEWGLLGCYAV